MQCLMCVSDHLANAMENWRAMCRVPDYARSTDGKSSHLCDFRADICQAEAQSWKDYNFLSREIREVKLVTEDVLTGEDVIATEAQHNVFDKIRVCWESAMDLRGVEALINNNNGKGEKDGDQTSDAKL